MKASILLLLALFFLASCKKDGIISPKAAPVTSSAVATVKPDTIAYKPDTIPNTAAFKIKLFKDNANYDETMFVFNQTSKLNYDQNNDAAYLQGYGQESLASLSSDGKDLAFYNLPYRSGMSVGLDVNSKTDASFSLLLSYQSKIPANIQIWVKDTYLKDSVDVRTANYNFKVSIADANSFGSKRFKLIIKDNGQKPTSNVH